MSCMHECLFSKLTGESFCADLLWGIHEQRSGFDVILDYCLYTRCGMGYHS
jgi:hypothetical protein